MSTRVHSKSGRFIALLPESLQGGFSVVVTECGVCSFKASWPCSRLPEKPIRFEFASNGDLVDIVGTGYDGEDMLALSQDAETFGHRAMETRRKSREMAVQRDINWRKEIEAHG